MAAPLVCSSASFLEAEALHRRIGADHWCVSRQDWRLLRAEVRAAVIDGRILPTPWDRFEPSDHCKGPSVYTVTDQYIKPVTAKAGGMSWALMQHPEGLKCDVFLTHAWQEGIFEVTDKVLRSLPWRAQNVWCCFLANPQNLDIAQMIRSPSDSPFAKALLAAPYLLAVPNETASIYTRLWCAYEAFLGHELDKVFVIARPPVHHAASIYDLLLAIGAVALGFLLSLQPIAGKQAWSFPICLSVQFFLITYHAASAAIRTPWRHQLLDLLGLFLGAHMIGIIWFVLNGKFPLWVDVPEEDSWDRDPNWGVLCTLHIAGITLFFLVSELDRIRYKIACQQKSQLLFGYSGTVRDAGCSSAEDERNLLDLIGERIAVVDHTIQILTKAGMSTSSLRAASRRGVHVEDAGFVQYDFAVLVFGIMMTEDNFDVRHSAVFALSIVGKVLAVSFFIYFAFAPLDVRVFAYRVLHKTGLVTLLPLVISQILHQNGFLDNEDLHIVFWAMMVATWLIVIPVSAAQVHNVASLPRIGPSLANLLAVHGFYCSNIALRSRSDASDSDSESSVDSAFLE